MQLDILKSDRFDDILKFPLEEIYSAAQQKKIDASTLEFTTFHDMDSYYEEYNRLQREAMYLEIAYYMSKYELSTPEAIDFRDISGNIDFRF